MAHRSLGMKLFLGVFKATGNASKTEKNHLRPQEFSRAQQRNVRVATIILRVVHVRIVQTNILFIII